MFCFACLIWLKSFFIFPGPKHVCLFVVCVCVCFCVCVALTAKSNMLHLLFCVFFSLAMGSTVWSKKTNRAATTIYFLQEIKQTDKKTTKTLASFRCSHSLWQIDPSRQVSVVAARCKFSYWAKRASIQKILKKRKTVFCQRHLLKFPKQCLHWGVFTVLL